MDHTTEELRKLNEAFAEAERKGDHTRMQQIRTRIALVLRRSK